MRLQVSIKNHGGVRAGAGRPLNSGLYQEPTQVIRVPKSSVTFIKNWLTQPFKVKTIKPPLFLNQISAGFPSPAEDHMEEGFDLNTYLIQNPAATFFVRVQGDSMINAGIHDGSMLVVDRSLSPRSGKIIIASLNGEFTVKRLLKKGKELYLAPENPKYQITQITKEMDFEIWGVVRSVIHSF
ncbi:MAG: response transcriptional repressor, RecA-mediated autopeptidase [Francisellaceae bacterium]|nr:response transcriptional repressor, RecA-mediated autopeptidase [Francisellaceae bacterium]